LSPKPPQPRKHQARRKATAGPGKKRKEAGKASVKPLFGKSKPFISPGSEKPVQRIKAEANSNLKARARKMKLLLLDVDGVLTDGGIYYSEGGTESKRFHVQDGMGIDLLQRAGIKVGILTGRRSGIVERRARELGLDLIKQGYYDKTTGFAEILEEERLLPEEIGYIGDDVQDLSVLKRVGFRGAPANAVAEVKAIVHYVSHKNGGDGAVRELADLILTLRGAKERVVDEISSPGVKPSDRREAGPVEASAAPRT
jgi:3-deoxy-D-manno-octulosonate 8-phosphate phosphatase (KDO 8-P phosphatase)